MEAYIGIQAEPGYQNALYTILTNRWPNVFMTLGFHDIVCRPPQFSDLAEFRKLIDSILFIRENEKAIVANSTSYLILDRYVKDSDRKPTAFCFARSGKLLSRTFFDKMVKDVYNAESVLSVSVTIGFFDLVCEISSENLMELRRTVDQILSTPGTSSRSVIVCMVLGGNHGRRG